MNWDEKAEARAERWPTDPDHGDCRKCQINEQVREGFVMGARWQRRQLRSDDAMERVARAIASNSEDKPWEALSSMGRSMYLKDARAAIAALLGEES